MTFTKCTRTQSQDGKQMKDKIIAVIVKSVLDDVLSALVKMPDCPHSAESHLCRVVANLLELHPDYHPADEDCENAMDYAIEHMRQFGGCAHG